MRERGVDEHERAHEVGMTGGEADAGRGTPSVESTFVGDGGVIGRGTKVFDAAPVRGRWRRLETPDDVLALMDTTAEGVVACVADAGATFLAPVFDELTAVA